MIELLLLRQTPSSINQKWTDGELFIKDNQEKWLDFSYTLEDKVRDYNMDGDLNDEGETKVLKETAIPFGTYYGEVRWSPNKKREVIWLDNVPHFQAIQIHAGNYIRHTEGCILVGYNTDRKGSIWNSKAAEADLVSLVKHNGNKVKIIIR